MKKVCFILTSLDSGGTERYLLRFLNYSKDNIKATVICKGARLGSLENDFKKTQATILPFKLDYFNIILWYKWYKLFKANKFDTVVDLTGNFGGIPMMIAYIANVKKRIVFYRYSSNQFIETRFRLLYNHFVKSLVNRFSTRILSNSNTAIKFFFPNKKETDKRFKVISNGIDLDNFTFATSKEEIRNTLGINNDNFLIGHIGRFDSSKNHTTIFKVARELIQDDPTVEFLFCGNGTDSIEFKKLISDNGIIKNTYLLGERSDVPKILKALDIFYFPSITEGQPNALIEAMLSNLPIVTSDIASIKEIVPLQIHKHLVPPLNINSSIKEIKLLKENPNLQKQYKLYNWAILNFNSKKNFKIFKEEL